MRVVFMGTPSFAVPSLNAVASHHELVAVYTRPDAASGRGSSVRPSPVKQAALEHGVEVRQPATLRDLDEQHHLAALMPDVVCVAAYGLILPPEVLSIPPYGCINVHASMLPSWRGAAPIQRAVLAGDTVTGVSIMRMEEGLDTGPFCEVATVDVDDKTVDELTTELAEAGAGALLRALDRISEGRCDWVTQDDSRATYAQKIVKSDVELSPSLPVLDALRRVRASNAQAPARIAVDGRSATVLRASAAPEALEPGMAAATKRSLLLGFSDGAVSLDRVRPDGKREMAGVDWARGARFGDGSSWEPAK